MALTESDIQPQMTRRRPGQSAITTPRNEKDKVEIQSGTEFGLTLGTPIGIRVMNENQRPKDYGNKTMDMYPRPSHADWTYLEKYGVKASSGGGRSSARETIGESQSILKGVDKVLTQHKDELLPAQSQKSTCARPMVLRLLRSRPLLATHPTASTNP
jgi:chorismate synthase